MDRRAFLASSGATAAVAALPAAAQTPPAAAKPAADTRFHALLDTMFYDRLADNPEGATRLGLDTGARAGLRSLLNDESAAGQARELARAKADRAAIRRVDRAALSPGAQVDWDILDYQLGRSTAGAERFSYGAALGRFSPYVLSQLSGAYRDVPDFLDSQHRIATAADADAYLARLAAFPQAIDHNTERQRADAGRGVFAPDYIWTRRSPNWRRCAIGRRARRCWSSRSPPSWPPPSCPTIGWRGRTALVQDQVFPALDRQRALVTALRAKASHEAGCWRLPDGDAYYAAAAEAATTVALSGDEIHRLGLAQVAEISARIDLILQAQGLRQGTVGARLVALNQRPDQLFANTDPGREQLLAMLNDQIKAMSARLPEQFAILPQAPVEVRRVPPSIQAGAPGGYYQSASVDGSRPGIYFINLRDTFDRPKFGLATLTHHEAVPGHHLQVMTALESTAIPLIRRRGGFSGYSEGWALYTEQLADEMGMYDGDPLGQVGYLQSLLFRATRLVVDSGMHAKRWSRERATDYLIATTGIARGRSQGEIDRYTCWPGQACSYKIGHTKWVELRDWAKAKAGAAWDPKAFHRVLAQGAMPLTVLERVVKGTA